MNGQYQSGWVNRRRVRAHALMLALALWTGYAVNVATPGLRDRFGHLKGADFLNFYTLGAAAVEHRGDALYNGEALAEIELRHVPQAVGIYFPPAYGPQVAVAFSPFARLPYAWAAALWMLLSALAYGACCYAVWRSCPNLRNEGKLVALLAVAFPGFFALVTFGQTSWVGLVAFTLAYFALRHRREFLAGACLGLLAYKPQLAVVAAVVLLAGAHWRAIAGALTTTAAQMAIAWAYFGGRPLLEYIHNFGRMVEAPSSLKPVLYLMHSWGPFWELLVPWHKVAVALYGVTALATLTIVVFAWRSRQALELRYAVLLIGSVVASPFLTVYDLVLLAPALLLIADWLLAYRPSDAAMYGRTMHIRGLLYWTFALPLVGPLARWTHVQLSVLAMAALLIAVARVITSDMTEEKAVAESKTVLASSSG